MSEQPPHGRPAPRARAYPTRAATILAAAAGALPLAATARAGAQDLRFGVTPTAQQVSWDDALGLDNTLLYGGRAGVVFGRRIELQGFYLTNQGSDARVRDLYDRIDVGERPPQNPGLGVRNYGAAVVYNFALGGFTPFVRGGGSVLRFAPDGARATDRVAFNYGGGLRFGKPGSLRFNIFAEDLRFRVDRTLLVALPVGATPPTVDVDANRLRSNLTYGAGLTIPFGSSAATYDDTPQYQLGNVAIPVDVFAGRQDFAAATGLPRQNVIGVRTGIDFGPLVGLRGFYWRGVNDDFRSAQGVQAYGAEAQFALNAGPGVNPFLIGGAAQIDFLDSYDRIGAGGAAIPRPVDQTALIVGGGAKIPIGARFVLTGAARNYLAAAGGRTQDVRDASQLRSNWQYSLGLSFGIGGRGNRRRAVASARRDTVFVERRGGRVVEVDEGRLVRDGESVPAAERVTVVERYAVTARGDTLRGAGVDSALTADRTTRLVEVRRVDDRPTALGPGSDGYATDRTVAVPVPSEGEIIIRYGPQRAPVTTIVPGTVVSGTVVPGAAGAPVRTFEREYRERGGRVIREYREADGTVSREFRDERNRTVREYRDPTGRTVREYVRDYGPAPTTGRGAGAPVTSPSAGEVDPLLGAPGAGGPAYTPGATTPGYTTSGAAGAGDSVVITKDGRIGRVAGAAPRASRSPAFESRVAARLDSLERAIAARDAAEGRPAGVGATDEQVRAIVRAELARDAIVREERARAAAAPLASATEGPTTGGSTTGGSTTEVRTREVVRTSGGGPYDPRRDPSGVQGGMLYSGATVGDGTQLLVGGRLDFGAIAPSVPGFRLVPELAVGTGGGGTSTYVAANALYEVGPVFRVRPRVAIGAGLLNFSSPVGTRDGLNVVVTPSYGASVPISTFRTFGRAPELVVEHQGVNFFALNRLLVGIGWRR